MIPYQLIRRKRDGERLGREEIRDFFSAYADERLPDYQMSAFLMAAFFNDLDADELAALVDVMLDSGVTVDLSAIPGAKVDKHSTGGVGDKASLVLAPLVACLGVRVPMMSGRGLGHTGGTVDKLESIPGFRVDLSLEQMHRQLDTIGCALITPTDEIVPLDRKLYALRDVTGTVESIPLIASSIMSKKIAEGVDGLVLDVKRGSGAFLPDLKRGLQLARTMIGIGEAYGCRTVALITAMDRPLGFAIGNAIEVEEAIFALRGEGPADLHELTIALAVEMLLLAGWKDAAAARADAQRALDDGRALETMRRIIAAQGGNPAVLDDPALLPQAPVRKVLFADRDGRVGEMDVRGIGDAAVTLGAGRASLGAPIDPAVGFHITAKPGQQVTRGEPIATVFAASTTDADAALRALKRCIPIGHEKPEVLPLVSHRVTAHDITEFMR